MRARSVYRGRIIPLEDTRDSGSTRGWPTAATPHHADAVHHRA